MPADPGPALERRSRRLIRRWSRRWGLPGLESAVSIQLTARLRRSLGRCRPARGAISLRPELALAPGDAFDAVLCHETAHVAAYLLHGRTVRPHGPEWSSLVAAAGFDPVVRTTLGPSPTRTHSRPGFRFEHRCPVCQTVRFARRRMPGWRCAECTEAGLEGLIEIRPIPRPAGGR